MLIYIQTPLSLSFFFYESDNERSLLSHMFMKKFILQNDTECEILNDTFVQIFFPYVIHILKVYYYKGYTHNINYILLN